MTLSGIHKGIVKSVTSHSLHYRGIYNAGSGGTGASIKSRGGGGCGNAHYGDRGQVMSGCGGEGNSEETTCIALNGNVGNPYQVFY